MFSASRFTRSIALGAVALFSVASAQATSYQIKAAGSSTTYTVNVSSFGFTVLNSKTGKIVTTILGKSLTAGNAGQVATTSSMATLAGGDTVVSMRNPSRTKADPAYLIVTPDSVAAAPYYVKSSRVAANGDPKSVTVKYYGALDGTVTLTYVNNLGKTLNTFKFPTHNGWTVTNQDQDGDGSATDVLRFDTGYYAAPSNPASLTGTAIAMYHWWGSRSITTTPVTSAVSGAFTGSYGNDVVVFNAPDISSTLRDYTGWVLVVNDATGTSHKYDLPYKRNVSMQDASGSYTQLPRDSVATGMAVKNMGTHYIAAVQYSIPPDGKFTGASCYQINLSTGAVAWVKTPLGQNCDSNL